MHTLCKYLHAKRRTKQASWLADPSHTPGRKLRVQQRVMILYDKTSTLTKHVSMFRLCRQNTRTKQRLHKWPAAPAMCWQRSPRCLKDFRQAHEHNFVTLCRQPHFMRQEGWRAYRSAQCRDRVRKIGSDNTRKAASTLCCFALVLYRKCKTCLQDEV